MSTTTVHLKTRLLVTQMIRLDRLLTLLGSNRVLLINEAKGSRKFINYCLFSASCPNKDSDPVPCLAKTYGPGGSSVCRQCPVGSECPSAELPTHVPCLNGTYADSEGLAACLQCPEGFTCPDPAASPVPCENGTYSFNGSAVCSLCPAGHR